MGALGRKRALQAARPFLCFRAHLPNAATFTLPHTPSGETVIKNLDHAHAIENRDAMAKAIYMRIFSWIFKMVNLLLDNNE